MSKKKTMRIGVKALAAMFFLIPYVFEFRFKFILASCGLLACLFYLFKNRTCVVAGLKVSKLQFYQAVFMLVGFGILSFWFIQFIATRNQIVLIPYDQFDWRISPIFQVLNEEIITRAILLGIVMKFIRSPWTAAASVAVIFAGLHFLLYAFNFKSNATLSALALMNLFLFGLLCNLLFLQWQHIWFGYAIHLGWNLSRFTTDFEYAQSRIEEAATFNIFEGQIWLTLFLLSGILISTLLNAKSKRIQAII